jgi:hypothetical protein
VVLPRISIFNLRQRSLVRGILLALGAFAASLRLAGFPDIKTLHSSQWQALPALIGVWAMVETARCLSRKWSPYHAGVLLLLYTDLMILAMVVFVWFLT